MSHLWNLVLSHHERYGPTVPEIARRMGVKPSALYAWHNRGVKEMPKTSTLRALAEVTRTPLSRVLGAALLDAGWPPDVVREAGYDLPDDPASGPPATHGQTG